MKKKRNNKGKKPRIIKALLVRIMILTVITILIGGWIENRKYHQWAEKTILESKNAVEKDIGLILKTLNARSATAQGPLFSQLLATEAARRVNEDTENYSACYMKITKRWSGEIVADSKEKAFFQFFEPVGIIYSPESDNALDGYALYSDNEELIQWMKQVSEEAINSDNGPNKWIVEFEFPSTYYLQVEDNYRDIDSVPWGEGFRRFLPSQVEAYRSNVQTGEREILSKIEFADPWKEKNKEENDKWLIYGSSAEEPLHLYILGVDSAVSEEDFPSVQKGELNPKGCIYREWEDSGDYRNPAIIREETVFSRYFWKGDFQTVIREPYYLKKQMENGAYDYVQYVLEYYYKIDYWKMNGADICLTWGGIYLGVVTLIVLITIAEYATKKARFEKQQYRILLTDALSHDLKTPLTALQGYAESLKENLNAEKKDEYVQGILNNAGYMDRMIRANTELLRLEELGRITDKETLDFVDLAEGLLEKYMPALKNRGIKSEFLGSYKRKANRELMTEALENLISNAVKYTSDGGEITVEGTGGGFLITNTVDVLPKTDAEKLWEPFTKGDPARSNEKGSGLGLAIAGEIIKRHKLKVHIECRETPQKVFAVRIL